MATNKQLAASFKKMLDNSREQFRNALPKHMSEERMVRIALTQFNQNPALQKCDPISILGSLMVAAQLGLEPGVLGKGYLVPYKTTCTFIPGWQGLVDLVSRSGRATVWTGAVYKGDHFEYQLGTNPFCNHRPMGGFEDDDLEYVYAIGKVKDSELPIIEVWPVKRVRAHFEKNVIPHLKPKHYAKKHFEMYARKVVLLQVLKYMPQSVELANAMEVSNLSEQGKSASIDGDFVVVNEETVENKAQAPKNTMQMDAGALRNEPQPKQEQPQNPQQQQAAGDGFGGLD